MRLVCFTPRRIARIEVHVPRSSCAAAEAPRAAAACIAHAGVLDDACAAAVIAATTQPHTMARLRIGLIGTGKHGGRYADHLVTDLGGEAQLVVLCRRDPEAGAAAARRYGCRFTPNIDEAATAPDVDAIVAVVPPTLNATICEKAAAAGKAILLEKPMAPTLAAAQRIGEVLRRHPVPFMVAHTLRFNAVVRALRDRLADVAPLVSAHLSQRFEPSRLAWLDDPGVSGGGIIIHTGVHSFDLLRFLTGLEAESVWCRAWQRHTYATEDNFSALLALGEGVQATVTGSRSTEGRSGLIELVGERGQLVGDHTLHVGYLIRDRARMPLDLAPEAHTVLETLRAFTHSIQGRMHPPIGWRDGAAAVAVAEACYRSAAAGGARVLVSSGTASGRPE
jgi:predicted dehydrogenase